MSMHAPPDRTLHHLRGSIRLDARLDATTRQKVDDLASHFRRPRAAMLGHIMHWGLSYDQGVVYPRTVYTDLNGLFCKAFDAATSR